MFGDQLHVDFVRREIIEHAVVGLSIDAPEPSAADIGDAWAELVAEQEKDPEDRVGITSRVGRSFVWSVRVRPAARTTPSFSEPARRSRSSQCSAISFMLILWLLSDSGVINILVSCPFDIPKN